jgi:hypothetical protein
MRRAGTVHMPPARLGGRGFIGFSSTARARRLGRVAEGESFQLSAPVQKIRDARAEAGEEISLFRPVSSSSQSKGDLVK